MISGSCLCGGVKFEVDLLSGPFELCYCNHCRKTTGSAFAPMIGVKSSDFRWVSGEDLVKTYEAPVTKSPPAYCSHFCSECGSPTPPTHVHGDRLEIPAGLLDDDPVIRPDHHIYVEYIPGWFTIRDALPQLDRKKINLLRGKQKNTPP